MVLLYTVFQKYCSGMQAVFVKTVGATTYDVVHENASELTWWHYVFRILYAACMCSEVWVTRQTCTEKLHGTFSFALPFALLFKHVPKCPYFGTKTAISGRVFPWTSCKLCCCISGWVACAKCSVSGQSMLCFDCVCTTKVQANKHIHTLTSATWHMLHTCTAFNLFQDHSRGGASSAFLGVCLAPYKMRSTVYWVFYTYAFF